MGVVGDLVSVKTSKIVRFITYLKKFKVNFDKPPRIFIIAHQFAGIPLFPGRTAHKDENQHFLFLTNNRHVAII
jgi:hypothetical protein